MNESERKATVKQFVHNGRNAAMKKVKRNLFGLRYCVTCLTFLSRKDLSALKCPSSLSTPNSLTSVFPLFSVVGYWERETFGKI